MEVMRTVLQLQSAAVLLMALGTAMISGAQQADKAPPKDLIQFINEAKRRGVKEEKIKKQAVAIGWPAAKVDEAIAYQKSGKASGSTDVPEAAVAPKRPAMAPDVLPPAAPAARAEASNPAAIPGGTSTSQSYEYQIGSGDTLQISVWKEPEVSVPSIVVRPDGKITVPLIREVQVVGLTPAQVEKAISDGLAKYITDANVTVVVTDMASKKIYVTGGVKKEGPVPYAYGMSVLQALSEAGGLTDYAKRKKIYILRTESGREYRLDFNYDEVVKGERMEQNILLLPNDTLVIPH
jgi:polysaccharide biosynthesis/export protein